MLAYRKKKDILYYCLDPHVCMSQTKNSGFGRPQTASGEQINQIETINHILKKVKHIQICFSYRKNKFGEKQIRSQTPDFVDVSVA